MGKKAKWFRTPIATPLQILILVFGTFYFIYFSTELFDNLPDFLKVGIYVLAIVITILSGASFIDSKKMAWQIRRLLRKPDTPDSQRIRDALDFTDDILYDVDRIIKKKKEKKEAKNSGCKK